MDNNQNENKINKDLDFVLGENFKIAESEEIEPKKPQKIKTRRQRQKTKSIIFVVCVIAAAVLLAGTTILFASDFLGIGFRDGSECTIEIIKGSGTAAIASELKEAGAINSSLLFRLYCKVAGFDGSFKYGVYTFTNELGYKDIAKMLQTDGESPDTVKVTIPEGSDIDDIIKILSDNGVCKKADFKSAMNNIDFSEFSFVKDIPVEQVYYRFEGYLFPDTYNFYNFDSAKCAELAISKMLKETEKVWTSAYSKRAEQKGYTMHQILSMASIIQLEASGSPNEMPKIAAVFYNRLKWDEPKFLCSSPTAEYPYGGGRYNTNKIEGLPPGPLCSPSREAIKAALYPEENFNKTYFVSDADNNFYYSSSYAEHKKIIAELKSKGKWIG